MASVLKNLVSTKYILLCLLAFLLLEFYFDNWKIRSQSVHIVYETLQQVYSRTGKPCNEFENQSMVAIADILGRQQSSPRSICNCSKTYKQIPTEAPTMTMESFCSDEATLLRGLQKVISYSLFYKRKNETSKLVELRYFQGVSANLAGMKEFYPGWVMRIYSNIPAKGEMCDIICSDEDIYYCDVSQLPGIGNASQIHPMTWRFLLIGDPTVEKFAIRDLDGRLSQRERDAVEQWEHTSFAIHGMRDHPWHGTAIMGGMWGADNYKLCLTFGAKIRNELMNPMWETIHHNDQQILSEVVYVKYKKNILTHDSYLCTTYRDSVPFPTKRPNSYEFVGLPYVKDYNTSFEKPCPVECRPGYGKDWYYC